MKNNNIQDPDEIHISIVYTIESIKESLDMIENNLIDNLEHPRTNIRLKMLSDISDKLDAIAAKPIK